MCQQRDTVRLKLTLTSQDISNLGVSGQSFVSSNKYLPRTPETSQSAPASKRSYDPQNSSTLGTIDAFQDFRSPEAVRASASTRAVSPLPTVARLTKLSTNVPIPVLDPSELQCVSPLHCCFAL